MDYKIPNTVGLNSFFENERKKALILLQNRLDLSLDDAEDIFQNACIALFENIQSGKLQTLTSTLSTYFNSICFNLGAKFVTRRPHLSSLDDEIDRLKPQEYDISKVEYILGLSEDSISSEQKQELRDIVQDLPSPCEEILWAYYGDNLNMNEIAQMLGYKNSDTAKAKKSWCMSRLKERFDKIKSLFYDN